MGVNGGGGVRGYTGGVCGYGGGELGTRLGEWHVSDVALVRLHCRLNRKKFLVLFEFFL